ncbi:MAG: TldD/PmbA family protein [bacterium]|nr:TldD/PmbA family protein [bacterium]
MIDKLKRNATAMLAQAEKLGADEAEVRATHNVSARVTWEKGDFSISVLNTKSEIELEVHKDQRKGTASTNEEGDSAHADAAQRALTLAKYSLEDQYLCLPKSQAPEELPGRFDPAVATLPPARLHELAALFLAEAKREKRLAIDGAHVEAEVTHEVIANSDGLQVSDAETQLSWVVMGMGKTETEVTSFDYLYGINWGVDGVEDRLRDCGRELGERVVGCLGPRKGESYKGAVLLSPGTLGDLLINPMQFHISGRQIMDGKSRWDKSLGKLVSSSNLTLVDNPRNLQLSGATPYDAEGVSASRKHVIKDGVLELHMDSTYSARRRGTVSTGHAGGLHAIEIMPGGKSPDELLAAADKLVVVDRFSGNLDPITGDFSGIAKCSHYYRNGQYQHPLTETMIAGNFFEMLQNIIDLSDQSLPWCNQYQVPWILVDGISVSAD